MDLKAETQLTDSSTFQAWARTFSSSPDTATQTLAQLMEQPENKFRVALFSFVCAVAIVAIVGVALYQYWKCKR